MITEDYVSFETAKLLKEKGFNEECSCFYDNFEYGTPGLEVDGRLYYQNSALDDEEYAAPTLQMAMKWLREVHKLGVFPTTFYREMGNKVKHDYGSTIVRLDTFEIIGNKNVEDYTFAADTYEETAEKTIKYCLENLI